MKFYTSGGSIYEADENDTSSPAGVKADGNMTVSGGEMLCVSARTGELFVICDAEGKPILKYELPRTINGMSVFFSSAELLSGQTYTVFTGGRIENNTVNRNGWLDDGSYSDGTELTTFTSNSLTTTIGQSNGPGGGPGNGGPGNGGWGPGWWH